LLVEDEPTLREAILALLQERHYQVIPARSPDEALALARSRRIDLLLTDVVMPLMSGPELAAKLRGDVPSLPVLFMSGYASDRSFRDQLGCRAVHFIAKPFTPLDLVRKVRQVLDLSPGAEP
jgi:two-component system, cell cycle sensor histidine kinase and response regulator CckA